MNQPHTAVAARRSRLWMGLGCLAGVAGVATVATALLGDGASAQSERAHSGSSDQPNRLFEPAPEDGEDSLALGLPGEQRTTTAGERRTSTGVRRAVSPGERAGSALATSDQPAADEGELVEGGRIVRSVYSRPTAARDGVTGQLLVGGDAARGTSAAREGHTIGSGDTAGVENASGAGYCGDNILQGNECEPPSTPLCSDDCVPVTDLGCFDCEQKGDCWEFSESCLSPDFGPDQQSLCFDVQECVKDSDCADGKRPLAACFCGDLSTAACTAAPSSGSQSPAGACADVIRDAMGGPGVSNSQVLARLINIAFPGGAALARMNCQKLAPVCTAACGF